MKKIIILVFTFMLVTGCTGTKSQKPQELETPQYNKDTSVVEFAPKLGEVHQSEDGVKAIIPMSNETAELEDEELSLISSTIPEDVWIVDDVITYNSFTMPEKAIMDSESGSLGVLSIPTLDLSVNIYEAEDEMEAMEKGAAHFKSTSAFDGNVGVSAHNINLNGSDGYFKNLHTLEKGDVISLTTAIGVRSYEVDLIKNIADTDWSYLDRSTENKITLITCITGKPSERLVVQALEK